MRRTAALRRSAKQATGHGTRMSWTSQYKDPQAFYLCIDSTNGARLSSSTPLQPATAAPLDIASSSFTAQQQRQKQQQGTEGHLYSLSAVGSYDPASLGGAIATSRAATDGAATAAPAAVAAAPSAQHLPQEQHPWLEDLQEALDRAAGPVAVADQLAQRIMPSRKQKAAAMLSGAAQFVSDGRCEASISGGPEPRHTLVRQKAVRSTASPMLPAAKPALPPAAGNRYAHQQSRLGLSAHLEPDPCCSPKTAGSSSSSSGSSPHGARLLQDAAARHGSSARPEPPKNSAERDRRAASNVTVRSADMPSLSVREWQRASGAFSEQAFESFRRITDQDMERRCVTASCKDYADRHRAVYGLILLNST